MSWFLVLTALALQERLQDEQAVSRRVVGWGRERGLEGLPERYRNESAVTLRLATTSMNDSASLSMMRM